MIRSLVVFPRYIDLGNIQNGKPVQRKHSYAIVTFLFGIVHNHLLDRYGSEKMTDFLLDVLLSWQVNILIHLVGCFFLYSSVKDWDKKKANDVMDILQDFVKEGTKQYHPVMRSFDFSLKRENKLKRIVEKHHKWLGTNAASWKAVQNASDSIELLRLYGFVRTKWKIWRINCKK